MIPSRAPLAHGSGRGGGGSSGCGGGGGDGGSSSSATAAPVADINGNSDIALQRLSRTVAVLRDQLERSLHTGAQVTVSRLGEPQLDIAIGEVRPGQPMRQDILANWMSTTKVRL